MKTFSVGILAPNSYFDAPVYLHKDYILLSPETPISEELIKRLNFWSYKEVYSDGKPVDKPSSPEANENGIEMATLEQDIQEHQ